MFSLTRGLELRLGWPLAAGAMCIVLLASCGAPAPPSSVSLEIVQGSSAPYPAIDETSCVVLRCSSLTVEGNAVVTTTSKSKSFKPTALLFLPASDTQSTADYVVAAAAPVTGTESEYDISQARYFAVKPASAQAVASQQGILFADWQAGAISGSDKFPCCEP